MILRALPALSLALAAPFVLSAAPDGAAIDGTRWAQVTIHERLIIRIPRVAPATAAMSRAATPPVWDERKGPRCLNVVALTGASIDREGEVDLVVGGVKRVRAKLDDDCPTLDFYSGLYFKPDDDGKICARRDVIRSRSGARCAITGFRTLVVRR
jgi:hypothetical protein